MSEAGADQMGQLQNYTVDQLAGAIALTLGALGSLLLVIWQSRCLCKCRVGLSDTCYIFDCSREPPPLEQNDEETGGEETLVPKQKASTINFEMWVEVTVDGHVDARVSERFSKSCAAIEVDRLRPSTERSKAVSVK